MALLFRAERFRVGMFLCRLQGFRASGRLDSSGVEGLAIWDSGVGLGCRV